MKKIIVLSLFSLIALSSVTYSMEKDETRVRIFNDTKLKIFVRDETDEISLVASEHVKNLFLKKGQNIRLWTGEREIYSYTPTGETPEVTLNIMGSRKKGLTVEKYE